MRKILTAIVIFILTTSLCVAEAERAPITFDDFIQIKRVSDPQLSPDGQHIAFVITAMDKAKNSSNSDIWILALKGGKPWQLTSSPKADFNPRWSPDGKKIAFISTRKGPPQIWMIDPSGGEAYQMTEISTGATGVIWSPTGRHLAFVSSVHPDCETDECNKKRNKARDESPVKAQVFDELLFRHWNGWRNGERSHVFVVSADGGQPKDVTPGDFDTPPISLGSGHDVAFSPSGDEICFVRNVDSELKMAIGTNNDLFITPIEGGAISQLTENRANDNSPHYSPDQKYIAYRAMARPGFEADKYSLILYDRKIKTKKNLTEKLDASVGQIIWTEDSSAIFITYGRKGRSALARVSIKDSSIQPVLEDHTFRSVSISKDASKAILLKQAMHQPPEIFALDLKTNKLKQLTQINTDLLARLGLNQAEEFWFKGAKGARVHGFLLKPPLFDPQKKYPLLMLIHGGPQG